MDTRNLEVRFMLCPCAVTSKAKLAELYGVKQEECSRGNQVHWDSTPGHIIPLYPLDNNNYQEAARDIRFWREGCITSSHLVGLSRGWGKSAQSEEIQFWVKAGFADQARELCDSVSKLATAMGRSYADARSSLLRTMLQPIHIPAPEPAPETGLPKDGQCFYAGILAGLILFTIAYFFPERAIPAFLWFTGGVFTHDWINRRE